MLRITLRSTFIFYSRADEYAETRCFDGNLITCVVGKLISASVRVLVLANALIMAVRSFTKSDRQNVICF